MRSRRLAFYPLGLLALALALRLLHVWLISPAPFFPLRMGDAASYHEWALRIVGGDWLGDRVFYQAPLYPYFLAGVYRVMGHELLTVRIGQAILGAISCVLLAGAGRRFFSKPAGLTAGLLLAFYAPAIFFDGLIQKSVLDLLFLSLLLFLLGGVKGELRGGLALALGLTLGCLALVRENGLIFVPVILGWLFATRWPPDRRRVGFGGLLLVGLAVVLLPVASRNYIIGGGLHLTTSQFGTMLYLGNNEASDGLYVPLYKERDSAQFEREDARRLAEQAEGRELTPAEVSRYWRGRALEYIRSQPLDWLALTLRKLTLFANAAEVIDTEDQYTYAEWSPVLRLTGYVLHFGVVAPLAVFGAVLTWRNRRDLWLLYLLFGAYFASVLPFVVLARYRYPIVPFLVLFAAAGLVRAREALAAGSIRLLGVAAAAGIATAVLSNWPLVDIVEMRAVTWFNVGSALESRGELEAATGSYRRALQLDPELAEAHTNLGSLLYSQGATEEASAHFRKAVDIRPNSARAQYNIGLAMADRGEPEAAIEHYLRSLRIDPDNALAHNNLANLLQSRGALEMAVLHYRESLRIDPESANAHFNLAVALSKLGRVEDAAVHLERTLRLDPDHAGARMGLEKLERRGSQVPPGSP